jgi:protein ImuB
MVFASIFVPNFMLQAAVRSEPVLRDRAVAIVDGAAPVWSVVALNEAAAKTGISVGMTKTQVQQFCGVEIRHRSPALEKAAHAALLDLGWSLSPRVEDTAPDTVVLDLAGLNSLLGSNEAIAGRLRERASSLGLLAQIAVASNIEAAIVSARGFSGLTVIPADAQPEILGNLPVNALSPSLEVLETLDRWGVRTCAALAALPVLQLSERLGQEGVHLHELARGQSERALVLAEPALHFEEEMELEDAVEELEPLSFLLGRLLGQLCARLEARSLAACAVRVRFELDPSFQADSTEPNRKSEPQSARRKTGVRGENRLPQRRGEDRDNDPPGASSIERISDAPRLTKSYEQVLSLPVPMRESKTLLNLLRLHLQSDPPSAPIVKIVLTADAARPRVAQGGLFRPSSPDPEKLELTMARLAHVVGDSNIGSPELLDTHRPGEFRMRRFVAVEAAEPIHSRKKRGAGLGMTERACDSLTGFRVFRPALPARVDLREGCPAQVRFQGLNGQVAAASGPWRSSGDWWREDGWQNDEWDLEIIFSSPPEAPPEAASDFRATKSAANSTAENHAGRGFYRIFFDSIRKEWFVRGAYD